MKFFENEKLEVRAMLEMAVIYPIKKNETREFTLLMLAEKKYKSENSIGVGRIVGWGGRKKPFETIEQAAVREWLEETDSEIEEKNLEKFAIVTIHSPVREDILLTYFWLPNLFTLMSPKESDEMGEHIIVNHNALPWQQMWDSDLYILPPAIQGKRLKGELWCDDNDKVTKVALEIVGKL